jgi:hypothetical protein
MTVLCHVAAGGQGEVAAEFRVGRDTVPCHVAADMEIARECVPHVVDYCVAGTVIEMPVLSTGVAFQCQTGEELAV